MFAGGMGRKGCLDLFRKTRFYLAIVKIEKFFWACFRWSE